MAEELQTDTPDDSATSLFNTRLTPSEWGVFEDIHERLAAENLSETFRRMLTLTAESLGIAPPAPREPARGRRPRKQAA